MEFLGAELAFRRAHSAVASVFGTLIAAVLGGVDRVVISHVAGR